MSDAAAGAFASFEEKWLAANPEQATAALFLAPDARRHTAAFGCLVQELEQAAFGLREAQVAETKLRWWRQELLAAATGKPSHPISVALFADRRTANVDAGAWAALADGALAARNAGTAADLASLLSQYAALYLPVARIEAALFDVPAVQVPAVAKMWTISHLLHALRHLPDAAENLPVPLDLLARHELTRATLGEAGAKRSELVRDFLATLAAESQATLAEATQAPLSRRVRAKLDLALAQRAQRADDPLRALLAQPGDARWKGLWWSWREARASARE